MTKREWISEQVNMAAIEAAENNWYDTGVSFTTTIGGCDIEVDAPFDPYKDPEVYILHEGEHESPLLAKYIADNLPDLGYIANQAKICAYKDMEDEQMLHRSLESQFLLW